MRGADLVLEVLSHHKIDTIFGYPGGAIMPIYDALYSYNQNSDTKIKHYLCCHEQGAGFAAIGYARSTGKVGVCFVTSGPGFTNLVTALTDAKLDSVPIVAISGQVASPLMGSDAFQEVDVLGLSLPITKHSFLVKDVLELEDTISKAFELATSGRPGPVLIDIPKDIQMNQVSLSLNSYQVEKKSQLDNSAIKLAAKLINSKTNPIFYVGGGVPISNSVESFRMLLNATEIPAVSTLKGLGSVPADYPYNLDMIGMHGTEAANLAVQECDLLICVGARFDDRVTGKLDSFAPNAKVIHIDIDTAEIGKIRKANVAVKGDLKEILPKLALLCENKKDTSFIDWQEKCLSLKNECTFKYKELKNSIYGPLVLKTLSDHLPPDTVISCDVGQHQMWVAQHMTFDHPHNHLTSGGLGTMGFGLPAAIGAQLARPHHKVINISGDGSIMMNVQELGTIKRFKIPVKIIILDNSKLGMVKQWQELFFEERYSETILNDNPDFVSLANAFDIPGLKITKTHEILPALKILLESKSAFLLHVKTNKEDNVWPIVPPNKPNHNMLTEKEQ